MKTCMTAVLVAVVASVSYAGDIGTDTQSVLVSQPVVVAAAPASAPCTACEQTQVCVSGQCGRLYNVETDSSKTCRNRLFGGYVVRNNSRTVYRPAARR
jgi:hypothetical protein